MMADLIADQRIASIRTRSNRGQSAPRIPTFDELNDEWVDQPPPILETQEELTDVTEDEMASESGDRRPMGAPSRKANGRARANTTIASGSNNNSPSMGDGSQFTVSQMLQTTRYDSAGPDNRPIPQWKQNLDQQNNDGRYYMNGEFTQGTSTPNNGEKLVGLFNPPTQRWEPDALEDGDNEQINSETEIGGPRNHHASNGVSPTAPHFDINASAPELAQPHEQSDLHGDVYSTLSSRADEDHGTEDSPHRRKRRGADSPVKMFDRHNTQDQRRFENLLTSLATDDELEGNHKPDLMSGPVGAPVWSQPSRTTEAENSQRTFDSNTQDSDRFLKLQLQDADDMMNNLRMGYRPSHGDQNMKDDEFATESQEEFSDEDHTNNPLTSNKDSSQMTSEITDESGSESHMLSGSGNSFDEDTPVAVAASRKPQLGHIGPQDARVTELMKQYTDMSYDKEHSRWNPRNHAVDANTNNYNQNHDTPNYFNQNRQSFDQDLALNNNPLAIDPMAHMGEKDGTQVYEDESWGSSDIDPSESLSRPTQSTPSNLGADGQARTGNRAMGVKFPRGTVNGATRALPSPEMLQRARAASSNSDFSRNDISSTAKTDSARIIVPKKSLSERATPFIPSPQFQYDVAGPRPSPQFGSAAKNGNQAENKENSLSNYTGDTIQGAGLAISNIPLPGSTFERNAKVGGAGSNHDENEENNNTISKEKFRDLGAHRKLLAHILQNALGDKKQWARCKNLTLNRRGLKVIGPLDEFCPELERLNVSNNKLDILGNPPQSLQHLDASHNDLGEVISTPLPNLHTLILAHNRFRSAINMVGLHHLRNLDVSHNQLESLADIAELPLITLNASHNPLQSLDLRPWATTLESINVSYCRITRVTSSEESIPPRHPSPKWKLHSINLSHNRIVDFAHHCQLPVTSSCLTSINIAYNPAPTVDVSRFGRVLELYCDGNNQVIGINRLSQLKLLSLRDMRVPLREFISWKQLYRVHQLALSGSQLNLAEINSPLPMVEYLELAELEPPVRSLPDTFYRTFPSVRQLNLSFNKISDTSLLVSSSVNTLEALSLFHNSITSAEPVLQCIRHLPELQALDLRANPFNARYYNTDSLSTKELYLEHMLKEVGFGYDQISLVISGVVKTVEPSSSWEMIDQDTKRAMNAKTLLERVIYQKMIYEAVDPESFTSLDGLELSRESMDETYSRAVQALKH